MICDYTNHNAGVSTDRGKNYISIAREDEILTVTQINSVGLTY